MSQSAGIATGSTLTLFFEWWKRELLGMLPAGLVRFGSVRPVVVSIDQDMISATETSWRGPRLIGRAAAQDNAGVAALVRRVRQIARRRHAEIGLRLNRQQCLVRTLRLPLAAKPRLAAMLPLEVERMLPRQAAEIVFDWQAAPASDSLRHIDVDLVVARRGQLDQASQLLGELGIIPAFVDAWQTDRQAFAIDLLAPGGKTRKSGMLRRLLLWLAAATVLAAVAWPAAALWQQEQTRLGLAGQIDSARQRLQAARAAAVEANAKVSAMAALAQLRAETPRAIAIWSEIAKVLPDTAYAEMLELADGSLTLEGRAAAAAPLVPALEASPLFGETGMVSAIVADPGTGLERFTLRAKLTIATETAAKISPGQEALP